MGKGGKKFYGFLSYRKASLSQAELRWGRGLLPPQTSALSSCKCDMKHCLTNSKHQHIGAEKRYVAFKICLLYTSPSPRD